MLTQSEIANSTRTAPEVRIEVGVTEDVRQQHYTLRHHDNLFLKTIFGLHWDNVEANKLLYLSHSSHISTAAVCV